MSTSGSGAGVYQQELSRSLSFWEHVFLTVSSVSPAGSVFIFAPALIVSVGGASVVALIIGAAVAACIGMCYGELAAMYPIAGGEYTWAARILGRPVGFALFSCTLVGGMGVGAIMGAGASEYLRFVWPDLSATSTAVVVIALSTIVATLDVRTNSWVAGACFAIEVLLLVVLTILGLMQASRGVDSMLSPLFVDAAGAIHAGEWRSLLPVVPVALLMLGGYQNAVYFAEETTGSTRQLGSAILVSLLAVAILQFVPLSAVIVGAGSLSRLMTAQSPMSDFVRERGGQALSTAMSIGIALAIINGLIVAINVWARILFASARDRSWPPVVDRMLATVHVRLRTPVAATLVVGAVSISLSFLPFNWLLTTTAGVGVMQFVVVGLSALRVRGVAHPTKGGYRMPVWPLPPVAVIVASLALLYDSFQNSPSGIAASLVILLVGLAYYYGFIRPNPERWSLPSVIRNDAQ